MISDDSNETMVQFQRIESVSCSNKNSVNSTVCCSNDENKKPQKKNSKKITVMFYSLVFIIAYLVRIHRIEKGNFVTWDEAHFGKFSQKYLDRIFYFDVHPPLGKMLTALSGWIHGQSNEVDFGSGENFPVTFDYAGMRRFHAFIASFTPLFGVMILREMKFSMAQAGLFSSLFILENGVVSISRLILLDSHLLTFTSGTIYLLVKLHKNKNSTMPLMLLGIAIGCVMSIKWIGCLTTLQVGLYIIFDLYSKILWMPFSHFFVYFSKRAIFLIVIPMMIYASLFYMHFSIVNKSGPDDGFMSSQFQTSLSDSPFSNIRKYVSYGKKITIKTENGYLHSHSHNYPDHEEYQVTTYNHKDKNNNMYLQRVSNTGEEIDLVRDGDLVVILHSEMNGYIQQTEREAYLSEGNLVSLNKEPVDNSAVWKIEIYRDSIKKEENLKAITSQFYLKNNKTGMYLCSTSKVMPSWAFEQGEIVVQKQKGKGCLFNVEENFFTDDPNNGIYTELKPSFFSRLLEHQKVMFNVNKSFVQDGDLEPERIVSQPYEWPLLIRGLRMSQWHEQYKFYMFMNPLILFSTTIGLLVSPILILENLITKYRIKNTKNTDDDVFLLYVSLGGWAIHYLPFFVVGRVLYLHHYFPALFFATLNLCIILKRMNTFCNGIFVTLCGIVFVLYSPLTYGFLDEKSVEYLRLLKSWDF